MSASVCFSLGLLFDPENGGDMLLRKVGLSPNYTLLQPRRPYCTYHIVTTFEIPTSSLRKHNISCLEDRSKACMCLRSVAIMTHARMMARLLFGFLFGFGMY
jgi:hypothetical protein